MENKEQRTGPSLQIVWKVLGFATENFKDVIDALCLCPPCPWSPSASRRLLEPTDVSQPTITVTPTTIHDLKCPCSACLVGKLKRRNQNTEVTPRSLTQDSQWHLYWNNDDNLRTVSSVAIIAPSTDHFHNLSRNLLIWNMASLISPASSPLSPFT